MPAIHVIAPDQRGYGRTTGWDADYDGDLGPFRLLNLVRDALGLVSALGYREVAAVVGHDFGSPVAAWCALVRPDVFRSVVLMSAPFGGPPPLPFDTPTLRGSRAAAMPCTASSRRCRGRASTTSGTTRRARPTPTCGTARRACTPSCAPTTTTRARTGKPTSPIPLQAGRADELAKLPTYYVMDRDQGMAETVRRARCPTRARSRANRGCPTRELAVYSAEYARTGFQGGLQWYRCGTLGADSSRSCRSSSGRTHRRARRLHRRQQRLGRLPGARRFERMQQSACTRMCACHLIDGAGHWVQQEQPEQVTRLLLQFLKQATERAQ